MCTSWPLLVYVLQLDGEHAMRKLTVPSSVAQKGFSGTHWVVFFLKDYSGPAENLDESPLTLTVCCWKIDQTPPPGTHTHLITGPSRLLAITTYALAWQPA